MEGILNILLKSYGKILVKKLTYFSFTVSNTWLFWANLTSENDYTKKIVRMWFFFPQWDIVKNEH